MSAMKRTQKEKQSFPPNAEVKRENNLVWERCWFLGILKQGCFAHLQIQSSRPTAIWIWVDPVTGRGKNCQDQTCGQVDYLLLSKFCYKFRGQPSPTVIENTAAFTLQELRSSIPPFQATLFYREIYRSIQPFPPPQDTWQLLPCNSLFLCPQPS